jgi:hypothetical protein
MKTKQEGAANKNIHHLQEDTVGTGIVLANHTAAT